MNAQDVDVFVGIPYDEKEFDCADLVCMVQAMLFQRDVQLPNGRPRGAAGQKAVRGRLGEYATRTDSPKDGDLVLLREARSKQAGHVGVYFFLDHEGWVLHSNETSGCAVLQRVRELPSFGAVIEGYYRWAA